MTRVYSSELQAAAQIAQREAISHQNRQPSLALVRAEDELHPDVFAPSISYSQQIKKHAEAVGIHVWEHVIRPDTKLQPHNVPELIKNLGRVPFVDAIMPLDPMHHDSSTNYTLYTDIQRSLEINLRNKPELDIDKVSDSYTLKRTPTALGMIALANLSMHQDNAEYYVGKTLEDLTQLDLREDITPDNIYLVGKGKLTNGSVQAILKEQGIEIPDSHIATREHAEPLYNLPAHALVFSATPLAEQIRSLHIAPHSVIVDAGFGVRDGLTYGNTETRAGEREDVLWTPPRKGVGPLSTTYLMHNVLRAAGIENVPELHKYSTDSSKPVAA